MTRLQNLTLEISAKPLFRKDGPFVEALFQDIFRQWYPLAKHAQSLAVLWWLGDGTDILEYDADMDRPIEWGAYMGFAHKHFKMKKEWDPNGEALLSMDWHYRPDPVSLTYGDLKRIVGHMRQACRDALGRELQVGITFEPGCEFCQSHWRYQQHPELLIGQSMRCIDATARMQADAIRYAGFPDGVPEGTPFGRFLGRQAQRYMSELGFDYIWFSNSFGFGRSPYAFAGLGEFFDGEQFKTAGKKEVRDAVLEFWQLLREECPEFPIECRGTDFTAGMNMVSHATPYEGLYEGAFNIAPPPNTPWPALTGNHGIALTGTMSQIAPFRGDRLPLRFYASDPWWLNTPWTDRYERSPRDIYLSGAITRLNGRGTVRGFNEIKILSIDTAWGEVPEVLPDEVQPHLKRALAFAPDAPAPSLWVYPFHEYSRWSFGEPARIAEVFAGDLLMEEAINRGLSLNCVVTTEGLCALLEADPGRLIGSVLVSPVPEAGSGWERALLRHVEAGGKVLCYGTTERASDAWLEMLGVRHAEALDGELQLVLCEEADRFTEGASPTKVMHSPVSCAGGVGEVATDRCRTLAEYRRGDARRAAATVQPHAAGGAVAWVRGTSSVKSLTGRALTTHDAREIFGAESLLRLALSALGWEAVVLRHEPDSRPYALSISRCRNGFVYAAASTDPSLSLLLRSPLGAPVLPSKDTRLAQGRAVVPVEGWFHEPCRVFVEQAEGVLSLHRVPTTHTRYRQRHNLTGLVDATVRFFPETGCENTTQVLLNPEMSIKGDPFEGGWVEDHPLGRHLEMRNVTGTVTFAWSPDDAVQPVVINDARQ